MYTYGRGVDKRDKGQRDGARDTHVGYIPYKGKGALRKGRNREGVNERGFEGGV